MASGGAQDGTETASEARRTRAFISYSRVDSTVAEQVMDALNGRNYEAYLDRKEILPGEPWRERLTDLITKADAVVFLISPDSVLPTSVCDWELNETERLGKRLLPVVVRRTDSDHVPSRLRKLNWIFWPGEGDVTVALEKLCSAIDTDIAWLRQHSRLGELAARWVAAGMPASGGRLLRSDELSDAESWLLARPASAVEPTEAHRAFLQASRAYDGAELERQKLQVERTKTFQRRAWWALTASLAALIVGSVAVGYQSRLASENRTLALAQRAKEASDRHRYDRAARYALAAVPARGALPWTVSRRAVNEAESQLSVARSLSRTIWATRLEEARYGWVGLNRDGSRVAALTAAGRLRILNGQNGQTYADVAALISGPDAKVDGYSWQERIVFSPAGNLLLVCPPGAPAFVYDVVAGRRRSEFSTIDNAHGGRWSADGRWLLTKALEGAEALWDARSGARVADLPGMTASSDPFSRDGGRILLIKSYGGDEEQAVFVYDIAQRRVTTTIDMGVSPINRVSFSPDGGTILIEGTKLDTEGTQWPHLTLWPASGERAPLFSTSNKVKDVTFSPRGRLLWARGDIGDLAGASESIVLMSATDGSVIVSRRLHAATIEAARLSSKAFIRGPNGTGHLLLSASQDGVVHASVIMELAGNSAGVILPMYALADLEGAAEVVDFAEASTRFATLRDGQIRMSIAFADTSLGDIPDDAYVEWAQFAPGGESFGVASSDGYCRAFAVPDARLIRSWQPEKPEPDRKDGELPERCLVDSAGQRMAVVLKTYAALLIDLASGQTIWRSPPLRPPADGDSKQVPHVMLHGRYLQYDDTDSSSLLVRLADGHVLKARETPPGGDYKTLLGDLGERAVMWNAGNLWIWSIPDGAVLSKHTFEGDDHITDVVVAPNGRLALVASGVKAAVWDLEKGQPIKRLTIDGGGYFSMSRFSDDGSILATQMDNGFVLWTTPEFASRTLTSLAQYDTFSWLLTQDGRHMIRRRTADLEGSDVLDIDKNSPVVRFADSVVVDITSDAKRALMRTFDGRIELKDLHWLKDVSDARSAGESYDICDETLRGLEAFTEAELADPILANEAANPCRVRRGALTWRYWTDLVMQAGGWRTAPPSAKAPTQ